MSGGHFNYTNDSAARDVFGWSVEVNYGLGDERYEENRKEARAVNPLDDRQISELVFDVFCLLHSYDWAICGDTCMEDYKKDLDYFKCKWFGVSNADLAKREIDQSVEALRKELERTLLPGCETN